MPPSEILIPYEYPDVVAAFLQDIGLTTDVGDANGTPDERLDAIIDALGSLFSLNVPMIGDDPDKILREIARDTKLANIAKERAFYRLYLLTRKTKSGADGLEVPMWYGLWVDDDGYEITTQEQFIGWFTSKAGLGRASTFRRIRVYQRLEEFGIDGQDAWLRVLKMPTVMQEMVNVIAVWDRNKIVDIDRDVAVGIANYVMPDVVPLLEEAFDARKSTAEITEIYKPVIQTLINDVVSYPTAKDALEHVKSDILGAPIVTYRWLPDEQVISVRSRVPVVQDNGTVTEHTYETILYVDDPEPHPSIMFDLFKRLPIGNRHDLPGS